MASLIDTNVLVYRCDPRFPEKRDVAERLCSEGITAGSLLVPHQAIVEFVSAVTRPRVDLDGAPLLDRAEAHRHAESLLTQFPVLYPDRAVVTTALRGAAAYGLSWFDAHLWAHAEVNGLDEIVSEDFEHGRHYGSVRARDPFRVAAGEVRELPALYDSPG